MKKSHFLTIAFAALAMVSCGNKNDNANNTEDSTTIEEDSTIVSCVSQELQPTLEALISNFNQNVDKNDANALATTLADMQVVYKNLVDEGKLEEAKTYGQAIQKYVSEHANELQFPRLRLRLPRFKRQEKSNATTPHPTISYNIIQACRSSLLHAFLCATDCTTS